MLETPLQEAQIQSLVRELRSRMPCGAAKKRPHVTGPKIPSLKTLKSFCVFHNFLSITLKLVQKDRY